MMITIKVNILLCLASYYCTIIKHSIAGIVSAPADTIMAWSHKYVMCECKT